MPNWRSWVQQHRPSFADSDVQIVSTKAYQDLIFQARASAMYGDEFDDLVHILEEYQNRQTKKVVHPSLSFRLDMC